MSNRPPAVWSARQYAPGPQVLTFWSEFDNSDQPYALYLPPHFNASMKYPLVVALHGAESNHRVSLARVLGRSAQSSAFPALREVNHIVAARLARGSLGYLGVAERDVYYILADVKRRFVIDENRVYLTGESMGGSGTFQLALTRSDVWTAIAPVCGGVRNSRFKLTVGQITNTVSWISGRHSFRNDFSPGQASGQFNFNTDQTNYQTSTATERVTGFGLASFLLGAVSGGNLSVGIAKAEAFREYGGFVQDDFKVSRRRTLNLGLRYDVITPSTERFNRYSNFNYSIFKNFPFSE